jgi:hypothetical protein
MRKFYSPMFSNLGIIGHGITIRFKDHFYETEDEKEIELLLSCGVDEIEEKIAVTETEKPAEKRSKAKK